MSEKKDNPYVSGETCNLRMDAAKELIEEKFKSLNRTVCAVGATTTLIITVVLFATKLLWKA